MSNSFIGSTGGDGGFDGDVSIAVVSAIAAERGVEPVELPPLYESIDPDALDALFAPTRTGGRRSGRLEFTYAGHEVVVDCGADLEISIDGTRVTAEPLAVGDSEPTGGPRTDA